MYECLSKQFKIRAEKNNQKKKLDELMKNKTDTNEIDEQNNVK
jgi:hypothetical protein